MSTPHPLVAALREERHRQGLSQRALAARLGYSHQAIGRWETGAIPDLTSFEDYATAMGFEVALYIPPQPAPAPSRPAEPSPEVRALMQQLIHLVATACGVERETP